MSGANANGQTRDDRTDVFRANCPHLGAFLLVFGEAVTMAPILVQCPFCGILEARPRRL